MTCGTPTANFNFTIADQYNDITALNVSATTNCGSGLWRPGGTITANAITGGSGTIQYAILKSNDLNAPNSNFTYGSATTFNVNSYGTYQVRAMDNCGEFFTKTVTLQPTLPPAHLGWVGVSAKTNNCNPNLAFVYGFDLLSDNDIVLDKENYFDAGGFKMRVWEQSSTGCGPSGCMKALFLANIITN